MFHEIEDIEAEIDRISKRTSESDTPTTLCAFDVRTTVPADEYEARLRSVLKSALNLAVTESYDGEDLPSGNFPEWFVAAGGGFSGATSNPAAESLPNFAVRGVESYREKISNESWELQEWLYQFDPESEFRGWSWWGLTHSEHGVRIWVDSWGESFFACDELRWAAFVCGAEDVSGPTVVRASDWEVASP